MSAWGTIRAIAVAIGACALLACGQSGLLVLPEEVGGTDVQDEEGPADDEQEEDQQE